MANLKEIRTRINSVKTTRQVTSAMKMVSAAKLKKAQDDLFHIRPFEEKLFNIIDNINSSPEREDSVFFKKREENRVLIVIVSSNRGLCGGFNSNIAKETINNITSSFNHLQKKNLIEIVAIGKQSQKVLKSRGYSTSKDFNSIYDNISYETVDEIAKELTQKFISHEFDAIYVAYNGFVNAAIQELNFKKLLPFTFEKDVNKINKITSFVLEPDVTEIYESIIPKAITTRLLKILFESLASEHGARMTSMHKATDNASDLIKELQLQYNKARQTSITNEILEIVSGAEALKG